MYTLQFADNRKYSYYITGLEKKMYLTVKKNLRIQMGKKCDLCT